MACPHPDVRRPQGRGAELGGKPKKLLFHPGATGEGKTGLSWTGFRGDWVRWVAGSFGCWS
jgi:hypothetical protein